MPDLKIYFTDEEDDLRRWFKETYGRDGSQIIKQYIQNMKEGKTEQTEEHPTGITAADRERITVILRAQFNGCYVEGEREYLDELYEGAYDDAKRGILRKLKRIQTAEPRLYPTVIEQLKKELPLIAQIGGVA